MKIKMPPKRPLVRVVWRDACRHHGWQKYTTIKTDALSTVVSVGFYMGRNREAVILAAALEESGAGQFEAIPKGCVLKMTRLR